MMLNPANLILKASYIQPMCGRIIAVKVKPDMINHLARVSTLQRHGTKLVVFTTPSRSIFRMPASDSSNQKPMYKKDGIGNGYRFSYGRKESSFLTWWIPVGYAVAGFSIVCLVKSLIEFEFFGEKSKKTEVINFTLSDEKAFTYAALCYIVITVLITIVAFSNVLLRMYYSKSSNEFIAVIRKYGLYNKNIVVKPGEVEILPKKGLRGNVKIKGGLVWWNEKCFINSTDFNILMGYDRTLEQPAIDRQPETMDEIRHLKKFIEQKRNEEFVKKYQEKMKERSSKKQQ